MNEGLREVIALDLAKSAALGHSRPRWNAFRNFTKKLHQIATPTDLQSLNEQACDTKKMVPRRGESLGNPKASGVYH